MTRSRSSARSRRARAGLAATAAAVLVAVGVTAAVTTAPALAATSTSWATWTVTGDGGDFAGTAAVDATGFPAASWTSDSRAPVGVPAGATTWLPAGSPVGQVYGSSQGRPYLQLRPQDDTPGGFSTTVLTFEAPTPAAGWAVVLGDVDADVAVVSGIRADGEPASPADLGVVGAFSFCDASPRPSTCSGLEAPYDLPTWSVEGSSAVLRGNGPDTTGAAGWLQPEVALSSLTVQVERIDGFPVVDVWLVALTRSASGVVTLDGEVAPDQVVQLLRADGTVAATVTSGPDGSWSVPDLVASEEWRARVVPPDGTSTDGPSSREVDVSETDAVDVNFALVTTAPEPTEDPTVEPTTDPTTEPTSDPTVEPTVEPTTEPTEPTTEPTSPGSPAPGESDAPSPDPTAPGSTSGPTGSDGTGGTGPGGTGPGSTGSGPSAVGGVLARTGATGLLGAVLLGLSLVGTGALLLRSSRGARQR